MIEMNLGKIEKGDVGVGYFIEELSNTQFTTYANVSSLSGVTQGRLANEGSGWLKFFMDYKELIVAKKPIRASISWDHLSGVNCIYGNKIIQIKDREYKVRLLKGADADPSINLFGNYVNGTHDSEWSRLFYPIVKNSPYLPEDIRNPNAPYTNADLGMYWINESVTPGPDNWCQEVHGTGGTYRVYRGGQGVTYFHRALSSSNRDYIGWRPCLELIP